MPLSAVTTQRLQLRAGHVRVSEIWVPVRRGPPKIIAHRPILVERASCPHRARDCSYGGKANKASEADEHDVEIIAWKPSPRIRSSQRPLAPALEAFGHLKSSKLKRPPEFVPRGFQPLCPINARP